MSFKITVPAKCILAGEHIILQRGYALVTPFDRYTLTLSYRPDTIKTMYTISGEGNSTFNIMLWPIISKSFELLEKDASNLTGVFDIDSSIPPCGGLGFSAAICVAVTEWLIHEGLIPRSQLFDFAVTLENMFHGKSSGLDIAGVLATDTIQYFSNREIVAIKKCWQPNLYISSSGETSFTEPCVKKVRDMRKSDPIKANRIDDTMQTSAMLVKLALETEKPERLSLLANGLDLGNSCFYDWDLVSPKLHDHVTELKKHALACKIIGAGFGGHVVSLWENTPPENLPFELTPLFQDKIIQDVNSSTK